MLAVAAAFLITHIGAHGSPLALGLLVAAGILLDFGVTTNLVLGQRAIFVLGAEYRSRLNGLYMAIFFAGGALGSALGGLAFAHGGWLLASCLGFGCCATLFPYRAAIDFNIPGYGMQLALSKLPARHLAAKIYNHVCAMHNAPFKSMASL
jgi:MFS family permease